MVASSGTVHMNQGCQMACLFVPKIPTWVDFGVPHNGKFWYLFAHILWSFGKFYGLLKYFMGIWYI
jgi:hypothetical protein